MKSNVALSDNTASVNLSTVTALNSSILPSNNIEANHKSVNGIYLFAFENGIENLSAVQLNELRRIAVLCPYTDGNAVFSARVILSLIDTTVYGNDCENSYEWRGNARIANSGLDNNGETNIIEISTIETFNCFPNPVSELLFIEYQLNDNNNFELYDILGKKIFNISLAKEQSLKEISVKILSQGLYYYKISDSNGNIKFSDKIIIVH